MLVWVATVSTSMCLIVTYLPFVEALNAIFISRFSTTKSLVQGIFPKLSNYLSDQASRNSLVYIPTASYAPDFTSTKSIGEQRRRSRYDAKQKAAEISAALGLENYVILELDAKDMHPEKIESAVADAKCIYVDGGNTFYLQKYIIASKFWESSNHALQSGCVYIGSSAGAIIAGLSIQTAYWKGWDNPGAVGEDFQWTPQNLKGRGLAPYSFFMHYNEVDHQTLVENYKETLPPPAPHRVKTVSDGEVIVLKSDELGHLDMSTLLAP